MDETTWSNTIVAGGGGRVSERSLRIIQHQSRDVAHHNLQRFWISGTDGYEREVTCRTNEFVVRAGHTVHTIDFKVGTSMKLLSIVNHQTGDVFTFDSTVAALLPGEYRLIYKPIRSVLQVLGMGCLVLMMMLALLFVAIDKEITLLHFLPFLLLSCVSLLLWWQMDNSISLAESGIRESAQTLASEIVRNYSDGAAGNERHSNTPSKP